MDLASLLIASVGSMYTEPHHFTSRDRVERGALLDASPLGDVRNVHRQAGVMIRGFPEPTSMPG